MNKMKIIPIVICYIFLGYFLMAIEPTEFQLVYTFERGRDHGFFGYGEEEGLFPHAFTFIENQESWVAYDGLNDRLSHVHGNGTIETVSSGLKLLSQWMRFPVSNTKLVLLNGRSEYALYEKDTLEMVENGELFDDFSFPEDAYSENHAVMIDDILFFNSRENNAPQYYSFTFLDERTKYRTPDETVEYIQNEYDGEEELQFDDDGYLFWGDRLVAPDGVAFYSYFHEQRQDNPELYNKLLSLNLVGWDGDNNSYWAYAAIIVVFNPAGEIIAQFRGQNVNPNTKSQFTMTEDGTLYVLSYNGEAEQFELMKLERFW